MRHQHFAKHFRSNFAHFLRCFANMNATFESVFERSLAAAAGVNLRLHDNLDVSELARDLFRFIECRCNFASRRRHIEFLQQLSGLIFVNVHRLSLRSQTEQLACDRHRSNGFC